VLNAISRSTFDLPTVLSTLVETAARLCRADKVQILLPSEDSNRVYSAASFGYSGEYNEYLKTVTFAPGREGVAGRVLLERKPVQIADVRADPEYRLPEVQRLGRFRTHLGLPLLREDSVIGVLLVSRTVVKPFDDKQIELLSTFAAQAVIAIENARLLNELRQRTNDLTERTGDLTEALERQTATADVLKVISRSTFDVPTVLNTLTQWAVRLCLADKGIILLRDGDVYRWQANHGFSPEALRYASEHPVRADHGTLTGRVALEGKAVQIRDVLADPEYRATGYQQAFGYRTALAVPLLREEATNGVFFLSRDAVNPFNEKQIELVTTFADQAVIAIENARLLNELRQRTTDLTEALEQQTATSDVLGIISNSPGDLQPVFDVMLANATRLCGASYGTMWLYENEGQMRMAARYGPLPEAFSEKWRVGTLFSPSLSVPTARVFDTRRPVQVRDLKEDRSYSDGDPLAVASVNVAGIRSLIAVPMLKENTIVGALTIYRQEVRPFPDKQIELVTNFAAQAVIAIENARLLNELRQSLEQQTATANVLEVISRSAFDLRAVFETVAESSVRLCGADRAFIFQFDGELLRMAASYNATPEFAEWVNEHPIRPGIHSGSARAALERRTIHIPDVRVDPDYVYGAKDVETIRTVLGVPILKGDELLGVMMIYHLEVRPFTDKQIELVETFADQAAIAIENVRLFEAEQRRAHENARLLQELRESTQEVVKLNQQLEQRVTDQVGEIERMGRLRRFLASAGS
jgi:GAF domain-containing protein